MTDAFDFDAYLRLPRLSGLRASPDGRRFTLSLRRLPLLAISFIQFLSPTVQMIIAVVWLGEKDRMTPATIAVLDALKAADPALLR